jgi:iron complex transport system substrate-binding protein
LGACFLTTLQAARPPLAKDGGVVIGTPCESAQMAVAMGSQPQRIASLCLQGDQYLLQLVPRERIAALSVLAADPDVSAHWEAARGIPVTHGGAEEVIRLRPDLVLVSSNALPLDMSMLRRCGVRTLELTIPTDFKELADQIRLAGRALGEEKRAEEIVDAMNARLARLQARCLPETERPTALFYFQDRFTPGPHTFASALLEAAGFRNLAGTLSYGLGLTTSMESVITAKPQYLILTKYREKSPTQTELSETEPLFRKLGPRTKVITVPFRDLVSPDPRNLELAEMLQQQLNSPR